MSEKKLITLRDCHGELTHIAFSGSGYDTLCGQDEYEPPGPGAAMGSRATADGGIVKKTGNKVTCRSCAAIWQAARKIDKRLITEELLDE